MIPSPKNKVGKEKFYKIFFVLIERIEIYRRKKQIFYRKSKNKKEKMMI